MSIEIKYFENRKDWRKWLNDNFETANEVWFVFPSKSSGEKSIKELRAKMYGDK